MLFTDTDITSLYFRFADITLLTLSSNVDHCAGLVEYTIALPASSWPVKCVVVFGSEFSGEDMPFK